MYVRNVYQYSRLKYSTNNLQFLFKLMIAIFWIVKKKIFKISVKNSR